VDLNVGQSRFRCDLAVRRKGDSLYQLGILVDTDGHYANPNLLDRYLLQPSILRAFGWRFALVLTKDWYHHPDDVLNRIEKFLQGQESAEEAPPTEEERPAVEPTKLPKVAPIAAVPAPLSAPAELPSAAAPSATRRFEFIGGSSEKFWEISLEGNSFTVRFGRVGTAGQSQTKSFADEVKAARAAESLIAEKLKKGYVEKR
jgi:predicted DNA-binding WGR domain protein